MNRTFTICAVVVLHAVFEANCTRKHVADGVLGTSDFNDTGYSLAKYRLYDEFDAIEWFSYAIIALCNDQRIDNWDCGDYCLPGRVVPNSVKSFTGPNYQVQFYVAKLPPMARSPLSWEAPCIAAFRGSVNFGNWKGNVGFLMSKWPSGESVFSSGEPDWCPECQVHSGFTWAYHELRPSLLSMIQELGCREVRTVGHSLGGAMAALAAFELRASKQFRDLEIFVPPSYLYGAPRVGNAEFQAAFQNWTQHNRKLHHDKARGEPAISATDASVPEEVRQLAADMEGAVRIVEGNDIVPRLPPRRLGYRHVGFAIWRTDTEQLFDFKHCFFNRCFCSAKDDADAKPWCASSVGNDRIFNVPTQLVLNPLLIQEHTTYLGTPMGTEDLRRDHPQCLSKALPCPSRLPPSDGYGCSDHVRCAEARPSSWLWRHWEFPCQCPPDSVLGGAAPECTEFLGRDNFPGNLSKGACSCERRPSSALARLSGPVV